MAPKLCEDCKIPLHSTVDDDRWICPSCQQTYVRPSFYMVEEDVSTAPLIAKCPFCGRIEGLKVELTGYDDNASWVICPCGARGPIDSPEGCVLRWNRRIR